MSEQQVTISLPESVYRQVEQLSQAKRRTVGEEVAALVTASFPEQVVLPAELESKLVQLAQLTDEELWRAARLKAPEEKIDRMQTLVEKQQMEGLTAGEKEEAKLLSQFFNRIMLVRAKTAVLLQERGYDIASLSI